MVFSTKEKNNKSYKFLASNFWIQSHKKRFHLLIFEILNDKQFNLINIQEKHLPIYIIYIVYLFYSNFFSFQFSMHFHFLHLVRMVAGIAIMESGVGSFL